MAGALPGALIAASPAGAGDSGLAREVVDCCGPGLAGLACSDLALLPAGRSRGNGTGSDDRAATTWAVRTIRPSAATTIGRIEFTFPPKRPLPNESFQPRD